LIRCATFDIFINQSINYFLWDAKFTRLRRGTSYVGLIDKKGKDN
jgi:hypothetical protein